MKLKKTALIILMALATSVSSFSQSLQPKKVSLNGEQGVFISFPVMDSITVKLLERKSLLDENKTLLSLYVNEKDKFKVMSEKYEIVKSDALKWEMLNLKSEEQTKLTEKNYLIQKDETKKARRNGLYFFLGGVGVGAGIVGVLAVIN